VNSREVERPTRRDRVGRVGIVALFLIILCLGSCGLLWAAQAWLPASGLPFGYQVQVCAGVDSTMGRLQVGFAWTSPFMSSLPAPVFFWLARMCGNVPWLPFLPPRGGFVFPP